MSKQEDRLTEDEIKQGCSAYIDHGGSIGFYCRFKPTLRYNDRLYCTRHDPVRLKAISDKRSKEYIESLRQAEQNVEDYANRLRQEGYAQALKDVGELFGDRLEEVYEQPFTQIYRDEIEALKRGEMPEGME